MIVYPAQPVFSFSGKAKEPKSCTDVPGPGNYSPPSLFQKVEKGYSFGGGNSRTKKMSNRKNSPGPGQYTVDYDVKLKRNAPAFGFGTDRRDKSKSVLDPLGPGIYEARGSFEKAVEKRIFRQTSERPCLRVKSDPVPGPGQYSPDPNKPKRASPQYGFGTDSRIKKIFKADLPAPGAYRINDKLARKTFSSWSMGYGQKMDPAKGKAEGPGPGAYETLSYITDGKKYGIGGKEDMFKLRSKNDSPGPGEYSPEAEKVKRKSPNFGFGTSKRLKSAGKNCVPNPQTYNVKDDLMSTKTSAWGLGYGAKIDLSKTLADTPGPGSYDFRSTISDGKKYGIGLRKNMFDLKRDNSPGPGHYKSEVVDFKRSSASYKWGRDSRFSDKHIQKSTPGPGMYATNTTLGGPLFGFGSGKRPGNSSKDVTATKDNFPGPGHYDQVRSLESYKPYESKA